MFSSGILCQSNAIIGNVSTAALDVVIAITLVALLHMHSNPGASLKRWMIIFIFLEMAPS